MATPEDMQRTMIANLKEKTGKTLEEWKPVCAKSGLSKHGQIVKMLKTHYGVTHGFANLIAALFLKGDEPDNTDLVSAQYAGKKAHLRPICDDITAFAKTLGPDVEIAPKKTSVSLRRKKQFAVITPATNTRIDLGISLKGEPATDRLETGNAMCSHKVRLESASAFDDEVKAWLKDAYSRAG